MIVRKRSRIARSRTFILVSILLTAVVASFAACSSVGDQTGQSLQAKGCKVDAAQVCARVKDQPVDMAGTGLQADQRMLEQNAPVTSDIVVPIRMPEGEPDLMIHCGINTKYRSVTYASLAPGPAVSDDGVKYLRARGYCSE